MKLLLYCTKGKPYLYHREEYCYDTMNRIDLGYEIENHVDGKIKKEYEDNCLNGKIIGECDFEVENIEKFYCCGDIIQTKTMNYEELLGRSCLTDEQFKEYNPTIAIHIKNFDIFDKPKVLSEYAYYKNTYSYSYEEDCKVPSKSFTLVTQAPQNMMIVYDGFGNKYALVSFHPESLCEIPNGKKLIDVRKVVLKEMLK